MRRTAVALGLASAWCRAAAADPEIDDKIDAGEAELAQESAQRTKWNELDLHFITLRIGGGALFDWATYWQDAASARQMMLSAATKLRDFRVLLKGQVELLPRVSYTLGYMYDAADQDWRFRQTGIMIAVPELDGQIFVGRTKEGFSTNKLMVGYNGFTIERAAANEAFLPILADGVKWDGQLFENQLVYNAGWFIDTLTEYEKFNMNDRQFAARAVWLPFAKQKQQVLHLAVEYRYGASDDGFLRFKSRPEVFPAQSFAVDTGMIPATSTTMVGFEAYYRPGPLMFGSEYFLNQVESAETHDPFFHGGEALVAYLFTGEVHPYNEKGAFFEAVKPNRAVFDGGLGAWEAVVRASYLDLDSQLVSGGKFWRITPVVNWYLSPNVRLEAEYGYSRLDRFGLAGDTQYVQARLQLTL